MSTKLFWFPSPVSSSAELIHDSDSIVRVFKPDTHPSGRVGISVDLPDTLPDKNGARLIISKDKYYDVILRGVLDLHYFDYDSMLKGLSALLVDDCILTLRPIVTPIPIPTPTPIPVPVPSKDPFTIIKNLYATGKYELVTKTGCGRFTEDCCTELHNNHSPWWGHIKKVGAQNQFNGHAVDAIQLLHPETNCAADVFDIIIESESITAKPAFNSKGPCVPSLWYYPA